MSIYMGIYIYIYIPPAGAWNPDRGLGNLCIPCARGEGKGTSLKGYAIIYPYWTTSHATNIICIAF